MIYITPVGAKEVTLSFHRCMCVCVFIVLFVLIFFSFVFFVILLYRGFDLKCILTVRTEFSSTNIFVNPFSNLRDPAVCSRFIGLSTSYSETGITN